MGFLQDKKILITGVISNRSIAHGVARAMQREGATLAFTYQGERIRDRVVDLAQELGVDKVFPCDVGNDSEIDKLFFDLKACWDGLDGLVHAIAYAPREALTGDFLEGLSREAFRVAHDISSYSFAALAKGAMPMMSERNASLLTLTYLGSQRAFPSYNVMGLAKASLEANVRYLAHSLGPKGIRVNAVSPGPIKTLAAAGIENFGKLLSYSAKVSPLKRNVTLDEVGNTAAFLCSDLASGITGEIVFVDAGFNSIGLTETEA